ncbi:hypothetical protein UPYG_G00308730 [Umbra pygmaea]|uniref:Ig-like domain-containing protein n=1 Tax=Umbra pygmaea TaxID=75934 RepID=A0ABD0WIU2_UMBPY
MYGGLGGEITITPTIKGQPEDFLWLHKGNQVVEFDGTQNVEFGSYRGRTVLDWHTGALTIKDAVAQPSVTCVVKHNGTTLLCSADLQPLTQFTWRSPVGPERPGSELFIPESENQPSVYTCVVRNPVSEKTAEFNLKDCHIEEVSVTRAVLIFFILFILLIIVIIVLALWWCQRKRQKLSEAEDQESSPFLGSFSNTASGEELRSKLKPPVGEEDNIPTGQCLSRTNSTNSSFHSYMEDSVDVNQERDAVENSINTIPPELTSADNNDKESPLDQNVKKSKDTYPQKPKRADKKELNNDDKPTNKELVQKTCNPGQPQSSPEDNVQLIEGAEKSDVEGQEGNGPSDKDSTATLIYDSKSSYKEQTHSHLDQKERKLNSSGSLKRALEEEKDLGSEPEPPVGGKGNIIGYYNTTTGQDPSQENHLDLLSSPNQDLNTAEHFDENQPEPQKEGSNQEDKPGFLMENPNQQTLKWVLTC